MIPYDFTYLERALTAFIGDLENKIHYFYPDIPVLFTEIDDSFYFNKKYLKTNNQEIYQKVPRMVIGFQDIQNQPEHNTSQFLKMKYLKNEKEYETQYRFVSSLINLDMNFITPNFVNAISYWEFLLSIFAYDNVFTFEYMGNTYQANYVLNGAMNIEKSILNNASGEQKNSVIKFNIELNLKVPALNYFTLKDILESEYGWETVLDDSIRNDLGINEGSGVKYIDNDENGILVVINSNPNSQQHLNDLNTSICDENKLRKIAKYRKKKHIELIVKNNDNKIIYSKGFDI